MSKNQKIQNFLEKEYSKIFDPNRISSYRIGDCGPPWIGALLSHIVACTNLSYSCGYTTKLSLHSEWKMLPNGKFSDVFYLSEFEEVDDALFDVNNFNGSNTRMSYNCRKTEGFDPHFSTKVAYFYPNGLEEIVGIDNPIILSDIWKSFLLKRVFKITPKYQNYVNQKLNKFKDLKNYAAIHIRRGDKVVGRMKESNYIETKKYFESLESSNYSFEHIFISTDSPDALAESISLYGSKYNLVYDEDETRHDGYPLKVVDGLLDINQTSHEELVTALKNFYILKNSNVIVGTPASWFFRISMLLKDYEDIQNVIYAEDLNGIPGYPEAYYHC